MEKSFLRPAFLCLAVSVVIFTINSCKKENPDIETQASVDNSICEGEFSRIFPKANHIAVGDSGVQKGIDIPIPYGACPDYYIDSADIANGFPVTMWLYYGADQDGDTYYEIPCTGDDGKIRQGVIRAVFNARWSQPSSTVIMTLQNYYVNGIKYEGTLAVTRTNNSFTQVVSNGKCSATGWTILWNSTRTLSTFLGDSLNPYDDVCIISGSASGTDRNGKTYTASINPNNPLRREMGCRWIVKGSQTITPYGEKAREVDYGNGNCDDRATLIIDGNEFEFRLQ